MADIDVDHWRNLQTLLLDSAKTKRRIIVIHEEGRVLKLVHSGGADVVGAIERVDDPHAVASQLYEANQDNVEFVAVFERSAFDRYFAAFQDTWKPDEDLDAYVHRTYAMLDEYPDGLVTYPGRARETLGLQWRVGATYEQVKSSIERFVEPDSSVVFGVFDDAGLWATLVLHFDADRRADVVTTADPSRLQGTGRDDLISETLAWLEETHGRASLGIFTDLGGARAVIGGSDKLAVLQELRASGRAIIDPAPERLAGLLDQ
jgi:hypothetical protein